MTPRLNLSRLDMPPAGVAKEGSVESDYASRQSTYTESNSCGASSSSDSSSEGVSAEAEKNEETSSQNAKVNNGHHKGKGSGKRARTLLTLEQSRVLHELLQQTCFPSTQVREAVAAKLKYSFKTNDKSNVKSLILRQRLSHKNKPCMVIMLRMALGAKT